jgi:hypothetical protein
MIGKLGKIAIARCLFPLLIALCAAGCNSIRITLKASAATNQGRPLQVLVRSIDEQTYRAESYSEVSHLITAPDESVLRTLVLDPRPDYKRSFCVKAAPEKPVAIYFLYTSAIGHWKMLILPPLPFAVTVPLQRNGIAVEEVKERRLRSADSPPPSIPEAPKPPELPETPRAPERPEKPETPKAPELPEAPRLPGRSEK